MTQTGRIIRSISGFYTVRTQAGDIVCRARGVFRKRGITPLAGDFADIELLADGTGAVVEIHERKNELLRPPVSNVDALVLLVSEALPKTDPFVIDKITAMAAYRSIETILLINKCDLERGDTLFSLYRAAGFPVVRVSAHTGEGIEDLRPLIANRFIALAGNSGVGKSTLLGMLDSGVEHKTGEVSQRLGRGRHTTRHVELFDLPNGTLAADTPGFSALDSFENIPDLDKCFIDFRPFTALCRFTGCLHGEGQTECAVRSAVAEGKIQSSRYESYLRMLTQPGRRGL